MNNTEHNHSSENKEEFCSLCVSAGLAVVGAGGIGGSTMIPRKKGETETKRQIGLLIGIISILLSGYFYYKYTKDCKNGRSSECA